MRLFRRHAVVLLAPTLLLTACTSDAPGHKAAEPATAPATSAAPAGSIVNVGDEPEGIVHDPQTNLVAVAVRNPDRLLLLDATTLAVRQSVPLPGSVRHLQLAAVGGPVLVPCESARRLVQIGLPGGAIAASTPVQKQPHDASGASGGYVVVGNEFGRSISIIAPGGALVRTVRDLTQPGGVIDDGTTVGVVDVGAYTLSTYAVPSGKRLARVSAGKGPTHGVLVDSTHFAVADTRGNALLLFDTAPLKQVSKLALPGTPYGMAVDQDTHTVWITLTARNQVVGVRVTGTRMRVIARYPTVRQPNTVAVDPGSHTLWITGTDAGVVERIPR